MIIGKGLCNDKGVPYQLVPGVDLRSGRLGSDLSQYKTLSLPYGNNTPMFQAGGGPHYLSIAQTDINNSIFATLEARRLQAPVLYQDIEAQASQFTRDNPTPFNGLNLPRKNPEKLLRFGCQ